MNVLLMIFAFIMLTGIGLMVVYLLDMNLMEGIFLASMAVVIVLSAASKLDDLSVGVVFLYLLSFAGIVTASVFCITCYKKNGNLKEAVVKGIPAFSVLFFIFCISMILYHGDFIQHYDELHYWALLPKYYLKYGKEPTSSVFFTDSNTGKKLPYFIYYFQKIAGYNEGMMYVTSALLYWIGLLLPFGDYKKKDLKKIILYSVVVYLALYSFYAYGTKNLYVDIPVATWTGGLIAWIGVKEHTKLWKSLTIILPALYVIYSFKPSLGWMLDVFILSYFLIVFFVSKHRDYIKGKKYIPEIIFGTIITLYTFFICLLHFILSSEEYYSLLPRFLVEKIIQKEISGEKMSLTMSSFFYYILSQPLTLGKTVLRLTFITALVICIVLICIVNNSRTEGKNRFDGFFAVTIIYIYTTAVYFGYIFTYGYDTSTRTISCGRYISIIVIVVFTMAMNWLMSLEGKLFSRQLYTCLFLVALFSTSLNLDFVINSTSWLSEKNKYYYDYREVKRESLLVKSVLKSRYKVFFINQVDEIEEFASDEALYELFPLISDYRGEPWKFTPSGSAVWVKDSDFTLNDLPWYLENNHYSYLWIYNVDSFLKQRLPLVFELDEDVTLAKGQLFRIERGREKTLKLRLIKNMIKFDDRQLYEETLGK